MALFRQLLTARQSVIIDDIETLQSQISSKEDDITALQGRLDSEVAKINALQSLTTSHTSQLNTNNDTLALKLQIENEKIKTVALQSLTESHTSQITSHDGDITALQGRLDIEEQNIIDLDDLTANHIDDIDALQTLTASHTTDIASNTADILTKQDLITSSSYLNCNSLTTNHLEVDNIISTSQFFDTIVVRRPTAVAGVGSNRVGVKELQCWVDGVNIMIDNDLTSYFTSWLNKEVDTGSQNVSTPSTLAYNNSIDDIGALSTSTNTQPIQKKKR
jgi:predicted  nucleic acid-binding Zn-ribbon protein